MFTSVKKLVSIPGPEFSTSADYIYNAKLGISIIETIVIDDKSYNLLTTIDENNGNK